MLALLAADMIYYTDSAKKVEEMNRGLESQVLSVLALLVQKYKY
jgi:hypothetical protein